MKNWWLFTTALRCLKFDKDGNCVECKGNDILLKLMDFSGVTMDDVTERLK